MNNLMIFENKHVEVFELNGIVYFNPYHVGACLNMSESSVKDHISKMSEKQACLIKNSTVGLTDFRKLHNTGEKFLTESGVYKLVFKSRKPEAEKFTNWVTDEVLPSIRKHGAYMTPEVLKKVILTPEFMLELVTALMDEQEKSKNLEQQIEADKPKVDLANAVIATEDTILVASFAKILNRNGINIGQNRLYAWLRENGYLGVKGDYYNLPTQKSLKKQLFMIKESEWYDKGGNPHIKLTAMVTGKGQLYFIGKFKEQFKAA